MCDLHIKLASTYLCVRRKIVREMCTPKSCANFGMDGAICTSKINMKVCGENGCANVARVEAMDVILKKKADNPKVRCLANPPSLLLGYLGRIVCPILANIQMMRFDCKLKM